MKAETDPDIHIPPELVARLRATRRVTALTGAGVSAESGVPTFRDAQTGLWARYDPLQLATPQAFSRDPRLVWEWYVWRRDLVAQAHPNPGHYALAEMERRLPEFTVITQNVDGLHRRAGSRRVLELHGNIQRTKCFEENIIVESWAETGEIPPICPRCGGRLRPDVVWFGESLPGIELESALQAAQSCEILFSIGTSGLVQPAASLPFLALRAGALVVEVNPEETPLSAHADYVLSGPGGAILPELVRAVWLS